MIEYKVRPVTRYQVTRYHESRNVGGCETCGEFASAHQADDVADALYKRECKGHEDVPVEYSGSRRISTDQIREITKGLRESPKRADSVEFTSCGACGHDHLTSGPCTISPKGHP